MDHLPLPASTPWKHIEVPLYTYDGGQRYSYSAPWDNYEIREGYKIDSKLYMRDSTKHGDYSYPERLKPQLTALVQSWLWFGVLSEFLQQECTSSDWIEECTNSVRPFDKRITTQKLAPILESWCARTLSSEPASQAATMYRSDRLLALANQQLAQFSFSLTNLFEPSSMLPHTLVLSIEVLLLTLTIARNIASNTKPPLTAPATMTYRVLHDRMKHDGWCPSEIRRAQNDCSLLSEYCMSFLGPVQNNLDHSKCTQERCIASQIDHATYRTRHVSPGCQCEMSTPISEQVAKILRDQRVPIVRIDNTGSSIEIDSQSTHTTGGGSFIAISHVWSDGLGNLNQNSLPWCQLRGIQAQVNMAQATAEDTVDANSFFWIDTICVPVGEKLTAERNTAIAQMVNVYRSANIVLILNAELQNVPSDRAAWELSARINRTAWFRRLWTLHEGVLSRKALFQLQDRALEMPELANLLLQDESVSAAIERKIFEETSAPYEAMDSFRRLPRLERSLKIWTAVHSRSTSNREDETICLANMLELDLTPILAIDRKDPDVCDKRMQEFILQQKLFPHVSPFEVADWPKHEPKMTQPGFRWAPKSFVFRPPPVIRSTPTHTCLVPASPRGLHIKAPGILCGSDWRDLLKKVRFSDELLLEEVDASISGRAPEVLFMLPFQWDVHYLLSWNLEVKWPLTKAILEATVPMLILERDLVNEEVDTRTLYVADERIHHFYFDVPSACNLDEAIVSKKYCAALVVAVSKDMRPSTALTECGATVIANATLAKGLFDRSNEAVWRQLDFPSRKKANTQLGLFGTLPATSQWCIG